MTAQRDHTRHSLLRRPAALVMTALAVMVGAWVVIGLVGVVFHLAFLALRVAIVVGVAALVWRRVMRRC